MRMMYKQLTDQQDQELKLMTPLISYTTSKNWQRRREQRTLTKHILLSPGWWVRTDNSDDEGACARIHGCLLFKSSCLILLLRPSSATDFPGIFYAQNMNNHKESKNGINVASPAHWTGCFGYKTFADLAQKNGVLASPFLHRMPEPCKCHYTVQHLLLIWVVFTQAFLKNFFFFFGDVPCIKGQNDQ